MPEDTVAECIDQQRSMREKHGVNAQTDRHYCYRNTKLREANSPNERRLGIFADCHIRLIRCMKLWQLLGFCKELANIGAGACRIMGPQQISSEMSLWQHPALR